MPTIKALALTGLLALRATAQTTAAVSNPLTIPTSAPSGASLENLVTYLLPSASITSITPSQSTQIAQGAQSFLSSYTQAHPISSLGVNIFLNQLGASTTPSPAQQSSLQALLNNAESGILADPSGFVASVSNLVSPFPFATQIYSYQNGIIDGMRTVVAQDVGVSVPTSASSSRSAGIAPKATQVAGSAMAMAAGLVGVMIL